jgi:hypothetical protein
MLHGYISQALSLHTDSGLPSLTLADVYYVNNDYSRKKYETVPKHKEMLSNSMFHSLAHLYKRSTASFVHAVINSIVLGCYTGFRNSEWGPNHQDSFNTISDPNWGDCPMALPVITEDFGFSTETSQRIRDLVTTSGSTIAVPALCIQSRRTMTMGNRSHTSVAQTQAGWALHKRA